MSLWSAFGWLGTILIVSAFALKHRFPLLWLAVMNMSGAGLLGASLIYAAAWPAVALQAIWFVIAARDLLIALGRRRSTNKLSTQQTDGAVHLTVAVQH